MSENTEPIVINFLEFDTMRDVFKEIAAKYKWNLSRGQRVPYESSTFYIGRGVTRFSFMNVRGSYDQTIMIVKELKRQFPDYIVNFVFGNINIYMRGRSNRK